MTSTERHSTIAAAWRGNRRVRVFVDEADYRGFVEDLRRVAREHGAAVIAYCLMPNHFHVCLRTDRDPLSVVMHRLNTRQAVRFKSQVPARLVI